MKIICITGIDGSGKTTLARKIVADLQNKGIKAQYTYGRTYPVLSRFIMFVGRKIFLRKHNQWQEYQEYHFEKKNKMKNPILRWVYTAAILFDYFIQIWFKLLPFSFSSRVIILDRYIYDTVISDLAVHLNYTADQARRAIQLGLHFVPMPSLTILIDLDPKIAFSRKNDVPHLDYLTERRMWYLMLAKRAEVIKINGEETADYVLQETLIRLDTMGVYRISV